MKRKLKILVGFSFVFVTALFTILSIGFAQDSSAPESTQEISLTQKSHAYECLIALLEGVTPDTDFCEPASTPEAVQNRGTGSFQFTETIIGNIDEGQATSAVLDIDTTGQTIFYLSWYTGTLSFSLERPDGQVIDPTYAANHPGEVAYAASLGGADAWPAATYSFTSTVSGEWTLLIDATNLGATETDFWTFATVETGRTLLAGLDSYFYAPGATAVITASVDNAGLGIPSASVTATIIRSDGITDAVLLSDQGAGNYLANYQIPNSPGFLNISVVATGSDNGVIFSRQETLIAEVSSLDLQFTGVFSDNPVDDDGNGLYEKLDFVAEVSLASSGEFVVIADLTSSSGEFITQGTLNVILSSGTQDITLSFDGEDIRNSQLDGPYKVTNLSLDDLITGQSSGRLVDVHTTQAYSWDDFGVGTKLYLPITLNNSLTNHSIIYHPTSPLYNPSQNSNNVVLLVHGWQGKTENDMDCQPSSPGNGANEVFDFGSGNTATSGQQYAVDYWADMPGWLEDAGYDVWVAQYVTNKDGTPNISTNASCLMYQVNRIVSETDEQQITIIAHSMGGLVSRYCIWMFTACGSNVSALVTLGSPHAGLPINFPNFLCWLFDQKAVCEMEPDSMKKDFNKNVRNIAGKQYYFIGGNGSSGSRHPGQWGIEKVAGPNDGLVGKYSAVGWVWDDGVFSPSNWEDASPPQQYWTDEFHSRAYIFDNDGNQIRDDYMHYRFVEDFPGSWQEVGAGSASGGGISNNMGFSFRPSIAIAQDSVSYVAWEDRSSGDWEIYVRAWNGSSWAEVGTGSASGGGISNTGGASDPSFAIAPDGTPYIAWENFSSGGVWEIYVRAWNGSSWVEVGTGSASGGGISNTGAAEEPSLAIAPDGTPYVAWRDYSSGNLEIYVRAWNGSSWAEVGTGSASGGGISSDSGGSYWPSLTIGQDGTPYASWADNSGGDLEIYVRAWNGNSWAEVDTGSASGGGISNTVGGSWFPSIVIAPNGTAYVAWRDDSSGNWEIYVRTWNGSIWAEVGANSASGGGISNNTGFSSRPSLAIALDGTPYVAWYDGYNESSGDHEIFVRAWNGSSWTEVGVDSASGGGISNTSGYSLNPSLAIAPDGVPYAAWQDGSGAGEDEIYIRRYLE